ncbi:uncharacterized protein LOC143630706 [Bidens hawaiensis]|uniref:uncharacterized protein LOC143630706 n=1 Tax=Bidens hawaiensis TaxID=980011 RepID=UPI00404A97F3
MTIIQQGVHDSLFSRIAACESAKGTWETLQLEYQGDSQVQSVKLQSLRREFESMKTDENVGSYFSRVMDNVGRQRSFVVFDSSEITPVKLMGLLQSQEERLNSRIPCDAVKKPEIQEEQALQVFHDPARFFRGRGRGPPRGRGAIGRRRGTLDRSKVPHVTFAKKDCWYNQEEPQVNVAENEGQNEAVDEEDNAFMHLNFHEATQDHLALMMNASSDDQKSYLWFIDSGCSNHMTSLRESFTVLDESFKLSVRLGNKNRVGVEGKGVVRIPTGQGAYKLLEDVFYAPKLEYNLLSVGQLMRKGFSLLFDEGKCTVQSKQTGNVIMQIEVASNNMFVLDSTCLLALKDAPSNPQEEEALRWHLRYGHVNFDSLKQLYDKEMVKGLPRIQYAIRLGLVHTDLCGQTNEKTF